MHTRIDSPRELYRPLLSTLWPCRRERDRERERERERMGREGREKEAEERAVASETQGEGKPTVPSFLLLLSRQRGYGWVHVGRYAKGEARNERIASQRFVPAAASAALHLRVVLVRLADKEWRPRLRKRREPGRLAAFRSSRFRSRVLPRTLSLSLFRDSRYRATAANISHPKPIGARPDAYQCRETTIIFHLSFPPRHKFRSALPSSPL